VWLYLTVRKIINNAVDKIECLYVYMCPNYFVYNWTGRLCLHKLLMIEIKRKKNQMYLSFSMSSLEVWLLPAAKTIEYNPINNTLSQAMIVWLGC
jgi:hypothetical protein